MSNIHLNHAFTPPNLKILNDKLESLVNDSDPDEARLLQFVSERDEIVTAHLDTLLGKDKKNFAEAELNINQQLSAVAKTLLLASQNHLSGFLKGRKAIKKYK